VTSFSFTNDGDEGYDKVIEEAKEEVTDQREMDLSQFQAKAGGENNEEDSQGSNFQSGLTKVFIG